MTATAVDTLWFRAHPDRRYRLRQQTPAEVALWPVPPGDGFTGWCIIRREDGKVRRFAIEAGDSWDDQDEEIEPLFKQLGDDA